MRRLAPSSFSRSLGRLLPPSLLLAAALSCTPEDEDPASWSLVYTDLGGALLSVWGTASDDVWAVGSDPGDGDGPYVLHWDGEAFERHPVPDVQTNLWWVTIAGDTVWMSGEQGVVLRHAKGSDAFETVPTPTTHTLFGVYSFGERDTWAVGGDAGTQAGVILHHDGTSFTEVAVPPEADGVTFFKVWGAAPNDLWIVGLGGTALHWDGQALEPVAVPNGRPVFTVHGAQGVGTFVVGGFASGLVARLEGGALVDETPPGIPQINGIYVTDDAAHGVGIMGAIWRREDGAWMQVEDAPRLPLDYHAVYVDPDGGVWAVGGNIVAEPLDRGVMAHYGRAVGGGYIE